MPDFCYSESVVILKVAVNMRKANHVFQGFRGIPDRGCCWLHGVRVSRGTGSEESLGQTGRLEHGTAQEC